MKTHANNHQAGFTLLEFIVTLVIAAIMAAMVYTYFGNALTKSSDPIFRLQKASNLHQVMENIVADYNRLNALNLRYKWRSNNVYAIGDVVLPSDTAVNSSSEIANNGRYYQCTSAHTSNASNLPTWTVTTTSPLTGTGTDGVTIRWIEAGRVWQPAPVLYIVETIVTPIYNNGHFYKCTTAGSNTGILTLTPGNLIWPTNSGAYTTATGAVWQEIGTILKSNEASIENLYTLLPALNDSILTTETGATRIRYGKGYTVTEKVFIKFTSGAEVDILSTSTTEDFNILKVTIKNNDTAETLTELFTIR